MFGIDLGITVSSITLLTAKNEILDFRVIYGNTKIKDQWLRARYMADEIVNQIMDMVRARPDKIIDPLVSIEEPILPPMRWEQRTGAFATTCKLYALVRKTLEVRSFTIYSINPLTVKATARALGFKNKYIKKKYGKRGRLNKEGMMKAFDRVTGHIPEGKTKVARETLADSFFIARTGLDRRKLGFKL